MTPNFREHSQKSISPFLFTIEALELSKMCAMVHGLPVQRIMSAAQRTFLLQHHTGWWLDGRWHGQCTVGRWTAGGQWVDSRWHGQCMAGAWLVGAAMGMLSGGEGGCCMCGSQLAYLV